MKIDNPSNLELVLENEHETRLILVLFKLKYIIPYLLLTILLLK
jgi:hypothetical protein